MKGYQSQIIRKVIIDQGMVFAAQMIQDGKKVVCPPNQYIVAAFTIWCIIIVIEYGFDVGIVNIISIWKNTTMNSTNVTFLHRQTFLQL
ncbi:unnamed protein product [Heterobilharzia americana]|nr:unnamed protein product [Heterobilharzia americana]